MIRKQSAQRAGFLSAWSSPAASSRRPRSSPRRSMRWWRITRPTRLASPDRN